MLDHLPTLSYDCRACGAANLERQGRGREFCGRCFRHHQTGGVSAVSVVGTLMFYVLPALPVLVVAIALLRAFEAQMIATFGAGYKDAGLNIAVGATFAAALAIFLVRHGGPLLRPARKG